MRIDEIKVYTKKGLFNAHVVDSGRGGFIVELADGIKLGIPRKYINFYKWGELSDKKEKWESVLKRGGENKCT